MDAGITTGIVQYGQTFEDGSRCQYPTAILPNPLAMIDGEIWLLTKNPWQPLWGIAVCGGCRGCGFQAEVP